MTDSDFTSNCLDRHDLVCDVLVAGGGPAGVPAAIAAARCGAKVVLCHDRPVLGGNASSEVRMHVVGADASGWRGQALATEAREGGIIEEIRLETAARNPQRSASMLDLILYEKCRVESNLHLLLNTTVTAVRRNGSRITHALAMRPSTEDAFSIAAKMFIDCTGDGRLGVEAGASFREGREAREEFDESMAREKGDASRLGSTLLFQARRHDRPMPFVAPSWARKFTEADLALRPHASPGIDRGLEYGYWWVEWGGTLDTIKDNETIRDELLAVMLGVWDHIKNGPPGTSPDEDPHGAAHWALEWFGFLPGKRESRRFQGQYMLTEHDVLSSRVFHDAIAYGGWPIDLHPPEGVDAPDQPPCDHHHVPWLYDIPLRACVSRDVPNLFFAGRNISATHVAFASTRVMATCAAVGQGVGTAAAYAVGHHRDAADLASDRQAMHAIQQQLLRDDAFLIDHINTDPNDLARSARIIASSELTEGAADNVRSGQSRAVHGDRGVAPKRSRPGTHRWMSDPAAGLPAWLELQWPSFVQIQQVQLIFDSGLHRVLTLSHSDAYVAKMAWGGPQPETIRDYALQVFADGQWISITAQTDNYQRRRVHQFDNAVTTDAFRIEITATHGLDHVRVCEIRVYGPSAIEPFTQIQP